MLALPHGNTIVNNKQTNKHDHLDQSEDTVCDGSLSGRDGRKNKATVSKV